MDKSWIDLNDRSSDQFNYGLEHFLEFAFDNNKGHTRIYCPCKKCYNRYFVTREVAKAHIIVDGFMPNYRNWIHHGETNQPLYSEQGIGNNTPSAFVDDMFGMVQEAFGHSNVDPNMENDQSTENEHSEGPNDETRKYFKLLQDAECPLYPGCEKFTKLSFIVRLLHIKVLGGWTDSSMTILLNFLKEVFPNIDVPDSYNDARKITEDLGFTYETWDACPNHCMLFKNEDEELESCGICHTSRYKKFEGQINNGVSGDRKIPVQQVRYFPLKPRLQRLFMSSKTASLMKWHAEERINDGVLRHPADTPAWKAFDAKYPDFASGIRNVRLGLASDGFSPFRTMFKPHSTWPVILMPYNLPPWMCMKQPFYILSILIDGPHGPGNKIDVYLQPLIDELKELWQEGVLTYDASMNQMFKLHATLLWTINDFPAYGNLSGWSTRGEKACPCCNTNTRSRWLTYGRKYCYTGHRRFLPTSHKFRRDKVSFDGTQEWGRAPKKISGIDVKRQLLGVLTEYKKDDLRKRKRDEVGSNNHRSFWKKKSIFFELPYWEHNLIRHNLDVMHIEKNCCENIMCTILGVAKKTKDNLKARRDLEEMGIRKPLHPQQRGSNKAYLAPACFTMTKDNKDVFLKVLMQVKVPDGYASNISRHVHMKERSIWGLKSHDHHILMQQLLPIAARRALPKNVVEALIEFTNFFRQLCSKVNMQSDLEHIQERIVHTLCHFEKIFPMSFFDVMEHLPIHLAEEALVAGAVQFRWMYPIERYLLTLKCYVRNRAHPEASIAKGRLMEECMTFCARYLNEVETKLTRPARNDDGGSDYGRPLTKGVKIRLDEVTWTQVDTQRLTNNEVFSKDIITLANGPDQFARRYKGYVINGSKFRTKESEKSRTTQNSGVVSKADTMSYATVKDKRPCSGDVTYYGVLKDVVEIRYTNALKFVLFKCDWVDAIGGMKEDEFRFTLVNFNHLLYKDNVVGDEPFILARDAKQVCYIQDPIDSDWHVVVNVTVRDLFDMRSKDSSHTPTIVPQVELYAPQQLDETVFMNDEDVGWVREGVDGATVDTNVEEVDDPPENEMEE
ncbi:unnamed protein product [Malus baccata var. baccata]